MMRGCRSKVCLRILDIVFRIFGHVSGFLRFVLRCIYLGRILFSLLGKDCKVIKGLEWLVLRRSRAVNSVALRLLRILGFGMVFKSKFL